MLWGASVQTIRARSRALLNTSELFWAVSRGLRSVSCRVPDRAMRRNMRSRSGGRSRARFGVLRVRDPGRAPECASQHAPESAPERLVSDGIVLRLLRVLCSALQSTLHSALHSASPRSSRAPRSGRGQERALDRAPEVSLQSASPRRRLRAPDLRNNSGARVERQRSGAPVRRSATVPEHRLLPKRNRSRSPALRSAGAPERVLWSAGLPAFRSAGAPERRPALQSADVPQSRPAL